jgi:hypothetical protein
MLSFSLIITAVAFAGSEKPVELTIVDNYMGGWEKLGSKKVNYGLDRDEILITASEGRFAKMKLKVKVAAVNMHKVTVHYGNGESQKIAIKKTIRKGGETRIIDLEGGKRVIKKVVFWYDTKNLAKRRATVEVWARH